jgi:uncharacterized protein (TIGR00725 family)
MSAMPKNHQVITVFGSSRPKDGHPGYEEARSLGAALAAKGFVVCSGGYGGVMEAVSRGAKESGGHTIGVTAKLFRSRANDWVDKEIRKKTWQDRLFELIRRGDGYVACTGGTGTLVELAVVWEMLNKNVMDGKPLVALGEFWTPIIERVREVECADGSPWGECGRRLIEIASSPAAAAEYLSQSLPAPPIGKK